MNCNSCPFWEPWEPGTLAGGGLCRLMPKSEATTADHWCGQHPDRQRAAFPMTLQLPAAEEMARMGRIIRGEPCP